MSLSCIYTLLDDIHEFCYVMSHTLKLHELLNYWIQQVTVVRNRVLEGVKEINKRPSCTLKDTCCTRHCKSDLYKSHNVFSSNSVYEQLNSQDFHDAIAKQLHLASLADVFNQPIVWPPSGSEDENAKLRQKISSLDLNVSNLIKTIENLSKKVGCHDCSVYPTPKLQRVQSCPPPPPPPPPPPAPSKHSTVMLKKAPKFRALSENNLSVRSPLKMDMVKMLKGLKDVKLKPTEKSPGGTPMRKRSPNGNNDTIDIFKAALKRRFASIHPDDFSCNKENIDDSWESSPNRSFMS